MTALERNLDSVRARIAGAALRVGRDLSEVTLVAVTKSQLPAAIRAAYELGLCHFAENRVEEIEGKARELPADITWHMIGHIQGRKARRVIVSFQVVHSVDSVELAVRLDRFCSNRPERLPILLECNVSGEASKYGFPADRWAQDATSRQALFGFIGQILALSHLQVEGLMTVAPIVSHAEETRPIFTSLRRLREVLREEFPQCGWAHLSMGMTDDFEVAVEEGATLVRIGRAIFAPDQPAWRTRNPGASEVSDGGGYLTDGNGH